MALSVNLGEFDVIEIHSAFVSQVEHIGFADLADAADELTGHEITSGSARLTVRQRSGSGLAGAVCYSGTLRTGSLLIPAVKVEVVVSPWSAGKSEIGIRPLANLGHTESFRANRFYNAARAVLPALVDELRSQLHEDTSAGLVLAA